MNRHFASCIAHRLAAFIGTMRYPKTWLQQAFFWLALLAGAAAQAAAPTISITNPAAGSTWGAPATITLTATAADSGGTVSQVQFFRGGTTLIGTATLASGSNTSGTYTFSWTGVATGTYSITAKATNNSSQVTTSSAVSITVHTNVLPTTSVTNPAAGSVYGAPAAIALTANAADSDGTITQVQFFNGSTLIGTGALSSGSATSGAYVFNWTSVATGTYSITAKATDDSGGVTTSSAVSTTVHTNVPPTVSITSPATGSVVTAPATIALTASAADSDGGVTQVQYFNGSTLIGTATRASGTAASGTYTFSWTGVAAGTYSITAKATDVNGAVTTSSAITVISDSPPTVSITSPATGASFDAPAAIALTAGAADSAGTVSQVQFFNGSTLIGTGTLSSGTASSGSYVFNWASVAAGSYTVTAKATDNNGTVTTSSSISLTVAAHVAPTVSVTAPATGSVYGAPAAITLAANAASVDGTITQVQFFRGGTTLIGTATLTSGTSTSGSYDISWTGVATGTYSITAKATDNNGTVTTSSAISATVHTNVPPTTSITSPANNSSFVSPASITLTASAADTDGGVTQVQFFNGSTLLGTAALSSGTAASGTYTYTWTSPPAGSYSLTSKATDVNGAVTTSSAIAVTVTSNAPTVSISAPTAGQTIVSAPPSAAVNISVNAATSTGTISKVDFYQGSTLIGTVTTQPAGSSYNLTWNATASGTYSLTAVATNSGGFTATSAAVPITVTLDQPPVVTLSAPNGTVYIANVNNGISIPLTFTASDPDGSVQRVEIWANGSNGNQLQGTILAPPANTPVSFNGWVHNTPGGGIGYSGRYTATAIAYDNLGLATTSAVLTITVNPDVAPGVGIFTPANNISSYVAGPSGATIPLVGFAASTTSTVTGVQFFQASSAGYFLIGNAVLAGGTNTYGTWNLTWNNVQAGNYSLYMIATDALGTTTVSNPWNTVNVAGDTGASVSLTAPANNASYLLRPGSLTIPATIKTSPNASTGDYATRVDLYVGTTLIGTVSNPTENTPTAVTGVWASPALGTYSLTAVATDNLGTVTTSAPVTFTIVADPAPGVSLVSPVPGATYHAGSAGAAILLSAAVNDSADNVAQVNFFSGGTQIGTGTQTAASGGATTWNYVWTGVGIGTYQLSAQAINTAGTAASSGAVVTASVVAAGPGAAPGLYFVGLDQLNTPRLIEDQNQQPVWTWQQGEPFGDSVPNQTPASAGAFVFNIRFPGQYSDAETNTNYNYFRDYGPGGGTYLQSDPLGLKGGVNTYVYAKGNSVTNTDPLGLISGTISLFAGVGAQITFGQNPNGSGFATLQFGWGIGGGASIDLQGQQPGYDPSQGNDWGVSTGLYAQGKFRAGPINGDVGPSFGRSFYFDGKCSEPYGNWGKPKISIKDSWAAIRASASAGGQFTFFGGGTKQ